jgi:hypothetical protein
MPYKDRDANREKINAYQREYARKWRTERSEHFNAHNRKVQAKYRATKKFKIYWEKLKRNPEQWTKVLERSRDYYRRNKGKINRRDSKEGIDLNSDRYIIRSLQHDGITPTIAKKYPELVEAKRLIYKIKRLSK